jgi:putative ABC transport system permease protein
MVAASRFVSGAQGFDTGNLLTMRVVLPETSYPDEESKRRFTESALERLASLPGVRAATAANTLPSMSANWVRSIEIEGRPAADRFELPSVDSRTITPGYFDTLRLPLVQGRAFTDDDRANTEPVAIVSASMAQRFWPGIDPIGRRFRVAGDGEPGPWLAVVGVSGDVIHSWFNRRNAPTIYRPLAQEPTGFLAFGVRTAGVPENLTSAAGAAIRQIDPAQPVFEVMTMERLLSASTAPWRISCRSEGTRSACV